VSDRDPPPPEPASGTGWEGRVLAGRFHVEKLLGRGGMGEVLLAHDQLLDRRVALKHVRADAAHGGDRAKAILQEARRASRINNRHVASVHDVVTDGDDVLIVMEFVEGESLRHRLAAPVPIEQFWDLAAQCLAGLGAAHAQGVIHRDIKPENLMLTHGRELKILDFGIARRSGPREGGIPGISTSTELHPGPAGTPPYMAPEAHYGGRVDERTDLFSLGAVFYEMLTMQHPFPGGSYEAVVDRIMNTPPRAVSELNPAVSAQLSGVIARMLARDPAQRFASCAEVADALASAKGDTGERMTQAATLPVAGGPPSRRKLERRLYAVAAVLAVVAALIGLWRAFAAPALPAERRLAVLPPLTPGATADFAAYALGATELMANRLMRDQDQPGFQMTTFAEGYEAKLAEPADARRWFGSNLVLRPTLEQRENRLRARLELLEPRRGRVLDRRTIDVPVAEPFAFSDSLLDGALAMLHLRARSMNAQADLGVRGAGTLRFLMQGLGRRRAAATVEARQLAIAEFETATRTEPDPSVPRAWLAATCLGQYTASNDTTWLARADAYAREAVGLDSLRAEAHRTLAAVLGYRKRHAEALEEYRIASLLDPSDDEAWYRWGRSWQRLGDAEQERKVYEAAIARRPHCFKPRWWLATWQYRNGHVDEALTGYREMLHRAPDFFTSYANVGGLLLFCGDYAGAVDTLRIAVELNPNSTAYNNLGTAYFNSGRLSDAVDAYNQAFQFGDADYATWMNLGDAYYWLRNRPDQARDAYRQAVRLGREVLAEREHRGASPDPLITAHVATVYARLGERDSARVMMARSLAVDSLNSRVQYQAALTQWQLGARTSAVAWLQRAVAGGYPAVWLRDSPVHRDWHEEPGFRALLVSSTPAVHDRSTGKGGMR